MKSWFLGLAAAALALTSVGLSALAQPAAAPPQPAPSTTPPPPPPSREHGAVLFQQRCASCHEPAIPRAPDRGQLAQRAPADIYKALTAGEMAPMATGLANSDIIDLVAYLVGGRRGPRAAVKEAGDPPACAVADHFSMDGPGWNGWSIDQRNNRLQPNPGLTGDQVPRLKVKWSLAYNGGRYGQPTIVGGRLFLTNANGKIYSLDAATGCLRWRYDDPAGARTTITIGKLPGVAPSGYAAYFGDFKRNAIALDAVSGKLLWRTSVGDHPLGVLTGAPVLYKGRLYVPLSSYEETVATQASYSCCTARGGVAALDAATGKLLWTTYAIEAAPAPFRKNAAGTQMMGPAGAAVWSAPTIDAKRGALYIATGDSYTDVKENGSDAVVAIDLVTGKVRWRSQVTQDDNYLMGCPKNHPAINCPDTVGPDHDFGASPILFTLPGGKDVVLAGQKSGMVFGMDPDGHGKILWRTRAGVGSALGGIEWGMAADATRLYVSVADPNFGQGGNPGLSALDPATGKILWNVPAPKVACGWMAAGGRCLNAQSAAPTVIPGLVFSPTSDGHLRAYAAKDGTIVWDFDAGSLKYATINGVPDASGGNFDVFGPTLAGGMMFIMSGYSGPIGGDPNDVLLAFSVDGK